MTAAAGHEPGDAGGVKPYRLSDQERSEAVAALADAYAEGRLDVEEFEARMSVASQARLATDLDPLFADLPRRPAAPKPLPAVAARGPAARAHAAPGGPPWAVRGAVSGPPRRPTGLPRGFPFVPALVVLLLVTHAWFLVPVLVLAIAFSAGPRSHHGGCHSSRRSASDVTRSGR